MSIFKKHINLTDTVKKISEHFIRSPKSAQGSVRRAEIILELVSGKSWRGVAKDRKVTKNTVSKWCERWRENNESLIEVENNPDITPKEFFKKSLKRSVINLAPARRRLSRRNRLLKSQLSRAR